MARREVGCCDMGGLDRVGVLRGTGREGKGGKGGSNERDSGDEILLLGL